jgi:hypothetical protein
MVTKRSQITEDDRRRLAFAIAKAQVIGAIDE